MNASKDGPRITVFLTILTLFVVISSLLVAVVTVTNYLQARTITDEVAAASFASAIDRVNERRISFFAPLVLTANLLLDDPEFRKGPSSPESRDTLLRIGLPVLASDRPPLGGPV